LIIKAKAHRTQEKNYREALQRLQSLLEKAIHKPKKRHSTKPSRRAKARRMDQKTQRGQLKSLRGRILPP
ncbi:MAG: hypothetical protein LAT55_08095, partial [Opitutales bacterium]|nr:hypothetical protein [Opitutales bacterium]